MRSPVLHPARVRAAAASVAVLALSAVLCLPAAAADDASPVGEETPAAPQGAEAPGSESAEPPVTPGAPGTTGTTGDPDERRATPPAEPGATPTEPAGEAPVPVPSGPRCPGGALGDLAGAGATNPADGQRYLGSLTAPGVLTVRTLDAAGAPGAPVARVDLPDGATDGGGLAFDAAGHLHVLAVADPTADGPGVARIYRTVAPFAAGPQRAVLVTEAAADRPVVRLGYDAQGYAHLVDADGSTRVDPVTGDAVARLTPEQGQALACGRPSHLTATTTGDLRVAVTGAGRDAAPARTVSGAVVPGSPLELRVTTATGEPLTGYAARWTCVDQGGAEVLSSAGEQARLTIRPRPFGSVVTCTATVRDASGPALGASPRPARPAPRTLRLEKAASPRKDPSGSSLGGGLPGLGGGGGTADPTEPTDDPTDNPAGGDETARPPAGLGLGGMTPELDAQEPTADPEASEPGPMDPVLPNTGGPSAIAVPVGLAAIVGGAVVLARRRRETAEA